MAGEGVPYQAQSEAFPDVPVRSEMGVPYIIKPEDWLKQAEFNLEQPGAYLNAVTKSTEGVTNLIQNTWQQQLALKQAQASLDKTVADTGYTHAYTDNIRERTEIDKQTLPLSLRAQEQTIAQNDYALKNAEQQFNDNDAARKELDPATAELRTLDTNSATYDSDLAAVEAKYPKAFGNAYTLSQLNPVVQGMNAKANASTLRAVQTSQLEQLKQYQDPKVGLIDPTTDLRSIVAQGRGQDLLNSVKQQETLARINQVKERAMTQRDPEALAWANQAYDDITGRNYTGGGDLPNMFDAHGRYLPGSESTLNGYEQKLGIVNPYPGATMEVSIDPKTGKPVTKITGLKPTKEQIEATQKGVTPQQLQDSKNLLADPKYNQIRDEFRTGKRAFPAEIKDPNSPEADQWIYQQYLHEGGTVGKGGVKPSTETVPAAGPVGGEVAAESGVGTGNVGNIWFLNPNAAPTPRPGGRTPAGGATPKPAPTPKIQNVPVPRENTRRPPYPRAGGGTRGRVSDLSPDEQTRFAQAEEQINNDPNRTDEEKQRDVDALYASLPGAEEGGGEAVATNVAANETQVANVQNAAPIVPFQSSPSAIVASGFNFGDATTFGRNYDGSIDYRDPGVGAFGHNTRDPRLVGASINVNEMRNAFGPGVVTPRADGGWDVNPYFARLARNGDIQVEIADRSTGRVIRMPLADIGPGSHQSAKIDLTYGASKLFQTGGRKELGFKFVDRNGNPIAA